MSLGADPALRLLRGLVSGVRALPVSGPSPELQDLGDKNPPLSTSLHLLASDLELMGNDGVRDLRVWEKVDLGTKLEGVANLMKDFSRDLQAGRCLAPLVPVSEELGAIATALQTTSQESLAFARELLSAPRSSPRASVIRLAFELRGVFSGNFPTDLADRLLRADPLAEEGAKSGAEWAAADWHLTNLVETRLDPLREQTRSLQRDVFRLCERIEDRRPLEASEVPTLLRGGSSPLA
ncbi:MAG: hypothetical protein KGJ23_06920 [Euryarchaeota archaeon]|nr:hypothetical protein [Euryarchaeota archaeon]MDE1836331.1 hypothetical protein [Euryarchaeota archaeon]MDE1879129.1 hypothetical protein [Euryarchaeota archaeon]MDE2044273.1 hypothetical protein [Thermoplasmata archaeon]